MAQIALWFSRSQWLLLCVIACIPLCPRAESVHTYLTPDTWRFRSMNDPPHSSLFSPTWLQLPFFIQPSLKKFGAKKKRGVSKSERNRKRKRKKTGFSEQDSVKDREKAIVRVGIWVVAFVGKRLPDSPKSTSFIIPRSDSPCWGVWMNGKKEISERKPILAEHITCQIPCQELISMSPVNLWQRWRLPKVSLPLRAWKQVITPHLSKEL